MRLAALLASAAVLGLALPAAADPFTVTFEKAGAQNTTAAFSYSGVETFNTQATSGSATFSTTFGTAGMPVVITGQYTSVGIAQAGQYGGADGKGNYAVTYGTTGYSLSLSAVGANKSAVPITYFGFWLSALDSGNDLTFYRGDTAVYSFAPNDLIKMLGACPNSYCGNPTTNYQGQNSGQLYAFLNFYDNDGRGFDRIVFSESPQVGGYESDNHTVGYFTSISGTPVSVPEPASLALLGAALVGCGVLRRRREQQAG